MEAGMADLGFAVKEKVTPDHDVIDEAIREEAEVRINRHDARALADINRDTRSFPFRSGSSTDRTARK